MAKRGRCRCGTVLVFQRKESGYKTRCPVCRSVVRLRVGRARPSSEPPLPAVPPPLPPDATPVDLSVLETHPTTGPIAEVEMEVYREPGERFTAVPPPTQQGAGGVSASTFWWLIPLGVAAAVFALAAALRLLR